MEQLTAQLSAAAELFTQPDQVGALVLLVLLVGTGLALTIVLRAPQVSLLGQAFRETFRLRRREGGTEPPGELSPFQALSAALAGSAGVSAIAGVATAICFGGPGALLWLWVASFLAMATKFAESTLAQRFRVVHDDGTVTGGPMTTIARGLSGRLSPLGALFAVLAVLAAFGAGDLLPASTIAEQVATSGEALGLDVPRWAVGLVAATLLLLVTLGGARRIGRVAALLIPALISLYALAALVVIAQHLASLPEALAAVFGAAFSGTAATGGFAGATVLQALRWGAARGALGGEAGFGASAMAHAAARTADPVRQGLVSMLEPFFGTAVLGTLTALAIVTSGVWQERLETTRPLAEVTVYRQRVTTAAQAAEPTNRLSGPVRVEHGSPLGTIFFFGERGPIDAVTFELDRQPYAGVLMIREGRLIDATVEQVEGRMVRTTPAQLARLRLRGLAQASGATLVGEAFDRAIPGGRHLVTLALILLAFSMALGWCYFGDRAVRYLLGPRAALPYRVLFAAAHGLGALFAVRLAWSIADLAHALMALPGLLSLWALAPLVALLRRQHLGLARPDELEALEQPEEPEERDPPARYRRRPQRKGKGK